MHPVTDIIHQDFAIAEYKHIWSAMQDRQKPSQLDTRPKHAIWTGMHHPTYTQGQVGDPRHLLAQCPTIPIHHTDRGGQITYHGPGQLMFYTLLDLKALGWGVRTLVTKLETLLIDYLADKEIVAQANKDAPGVYIANAKLASIGLRVRHGLTYHGMAINVNMDLSPFLNIRPCGIDQMQMTQLAAHGIETNCQALATTLAQRFANAAALTRRTEPWHPID